jgi:hypothetical protein
MTPSTSSSIDFHQQTKTITLTYRAALTTPPGTLPGGATMAQRNRLQRLIAIPTGVDPVALQASCQHNLFCRHPQQDMLFYLVRRTGEFRQ